jgi:hypothetical protein
MVEELQMPQRGPRGVRDVPAEQFIRAYAEHLKANDKVGLLCLAPRRGEQFAASLQPIVLLTAALNICRPTHLISD